MRRTSLSLSAQLHGMFFLAESPYTTSPSENALPQQGAELTCYRRNLFQITGSVTLPRGMRYIMTDQGDRIPILAQELTVSATESVEGNPVKIISVPWKTPAAAAANSGTALEDNSNNSGSATKVEKEPPPIPLDIMAGQDLDTDYATFPITWKRLQFRVATANNGRRKELQQHFVVRLKVVATLSTGAKIAISEVQSGPVIVRGRSPRNFQSRKDLPLSGSAAASRKNQANAAAALNRTSTSDSVPRHASITPAKNKAQSTTVQSSSPETTSVPPPSRVQQTQATPDWTAMPQSTSNHVMSHAHQSLFPNSSPEQLSRAVDAQRHANSTTATGAAPINLSLLDEHQSGDASLPFDQKMTPHYTNDLSQHRPAGMDQSAPPTKMRKLSHGVPQTPSRSATSSLPLLESSNLPQQFVSSLPFPNESTDFLYEYFPLGLDDWQAPVDAVYRPHVVHHTNMPEMKFVASRGRSKRYFAAEDVF